MKRNQTERKKKRKIKCERVDEKLWKNYFDHETAFFSLDMLFFSFIHSFERSFFSFILANIFRIFVTLWFARV